MSRLLVSFFVVFGLINGVNAQANGVCFGPIRYGEENTPQLMRVEASTPRIHFIESKSDKTPKCPSSGSACQRKGFVVPGDLVLASSAEGGFSCVSYMSPKAKRVKYRVAETSGYLPAVALVAAGKPQTDLKDWVGFFARESEGKIEITLLPGGKLKIDGYATFGGHDPQRVKLGAINHGMLEGEVAPTSNMIALGEDYNGLKAPEKGDDGECRARLRLYGHYLAVEDNGECGGMNVRFTGVYAKIAQP